MLRVLLPVLMVITACTQVIIAPTDTPVPEPTVDVAATVEAMVAERAPTPTATLLPTLTPRPTYTPVPIPTQTPTPTRTPTPQPTWTPVPTWTPTPLPTPTRTPTPTPRPTPTFTPAPTATPSLEAMVSEARPSVVYISTPSGTGTGFIVDSAKGYILTNQHVVKDYRTVNVTLHQHGRVTARVRVTDAARDIALLQINTDHLGSISALSFASSVRTGEAVIALGYPLGYTLGSDLTVTRGIVSSLRTYEGVDYVQTDAAINPGNSGGPLLNAKGRVVGMNTSGYREYEGLNFAIQYNVLRNRLPIMAAQAEAPATPTPTAPPVPPNYGPVGGVIAHDPEDGYIDVFRTDFWMKNGVIAARFFNPYPQTVGEWSSGFLFRHPRTNYFHLVIIRYNKTWEHSLRLGANEDGTDNERDLDSGYSRHITTGEGEYNDITIAFVGDEGWLYVNDQEIATLDLGGLTEGGYVTLAGGYYNSDGVAGYSTRFEDLTIWRTE